MKLAYLALVPVLATSAPAYTAEPATQTPAMDMQCLVIASVAQQALSVPDMKQVAMLAGLFYLGRVSGQMTDAEMEAAAFAETEALKAADDGEKIQAVFAQCGEFMAAKGQVLQAIGERMSAAEQRDAEAKK